MTLPLVHDVVDGLDVLICGLDEHGTIVIFNRRCEQCTGLEREHAVGTRWLDLFAIGERHGQVHTLWREAAPDLPSGPYEALCRNGRSLRWQFTRSERSLPFPVDLWAVGLDITDEREAEARARANERVVAVGNLISGLTHELRNPLNGALLQLELAARAASRQEADANGPIAQAVTRASAEVRRISALLDDFLVFVRPIPIRLERVDLRPIVEKAIDRARAKAIAAGVEIILEPGAQARGEADTGRIETAVYNLLANAIDAAAAAAVHEIRARLGVRGNAIEIEIEDRGAGLPSSAARIFEPYYTTKQGGTGLGLSIVQRVAADHGGAVSYERRDGATVFRLELPIVGGAIN